MPLVLYSIPFDISVMSSLVELSQPTLGFLLLTSRNLYKIYFMVKDGISLRNYQENLPIFQVSKEEKEAITEELTSTVSNSIGYVIGGTAGLGLIGLCLGIKAYGVPMLLAKGAKTETVFGSLKTIVKITAKNIFEALND